MASVSKRRFLKTLAGAASLTTLDLASLAAMPHMIFNDRLDAGVAAFFLVSVIVIVAESVRTWIGVVSGRVPANSSEVPAQSVALFPGD